MPPTPMSSPAPFRRRPALVLTGAVLAAVVGTGPAVGSGPEDGRPLGRSAEPVRVYGDEVPTLQGWEAERIGVLAYRDGAWQDVPFQIDERNPYGYLVLDQGPKGSSDGDGGRFDDNDEIVFMASDAGGRPGGVEGRDPGALPGVETFAEVGLRDAAGNEAWVVVAGFTEAAPRAGDDYVEYDPRRDRIRTASYQMAFPRDANGDPRFFPDEVRVETAAGGSGEDLLDRLKIRASAGVLMDLISFSRTEEDFRAQLLAWRDGPVRAVRRVELAVHILFGIYAPPMAVDLVYYRDSLEAPIIIDSPFNVGTVLSSLDMSVDFDLSENALGARLITPDNPALDPIDGRMTESEEELVRPGQPWQLIGGPQGHVLSRLDIGATLPLEEEVRYVDDGDATNEPEDHDGVHEVGRTLVGGLGIQKGRHDLTLHVHVLPHYQPGDELARVAALDEPIAVSLNGPATEGSTASPDDRGPSTDTGWRETLERVSRAVRDLDAYGATLGQRSTVFRGRQLEGYRTYEGRFHRSPRWSAWKLEDFEGNYEDPVTPGTESSYLRDENRLLVQSTGIRRVFGTVELAPDDAAQWWWGETLTNHDLWTMVTSWEELAGAGTGSLEQTTVRGRPVLALTLRSGAGGPTKSLRERLRGGYAQPAVSRIRILVDPGTQLPVRVESYIPGIDEPVASLDFLAIDLDVELDRDDFDLSWF